ncbi:hypothetical protein AcV5_003698 [Taiwanofungus camphoratus]|nr:hypothetical protein AcV5_003698 [Antrodia cinnamomea]
MCVSDAALSAYGATCCICVDPVLVYTSELRPVQYGPERYTCRDFWKVANVSHRLFRTMGHVLPVRL